MTFPSLNITIIYFLLYVFITDVFNSSNLLVSQASTQIAKMANSSSIQIEVLYLDYLLLLMK